MLSLGTLPFNKSSAERMYSPMICRDSLIPNVSAVLISVAFSQPGTYLWKKFINSLTCLRPSISPLVRLSELVESILGILVEFMAHSSSFTHLYRFTDLRAISHSPAASACATLQKRA